MSARPPAQKKGMRSHQASLVVGTGSTRSPWGRVERPSYYRMVSYRMMIVRNGLVTECVVDQSSGRLLANGRASDDGRGAPRR